MTTTDSTIAYKVQVRTPGGWKDTVSAPLSHPTDVLDALATVTGSSLSPTLYSHLWWAMEDGTLPIHEVSTEHVDARIIRA
jgi:hypothetical protein